MPAQDPSNYQEELDVAGDIADQAAALALEYFVSGVTSTAKADGSPVTEADLAVEGLLHGLLSNAFPDDAFLGEEYGQQGESERLWILDPIDGTRFFCRRDPNWRIHIALEVRGVTQLAVVTAPALGIRWCAVRGEGAYESAWPDDAGKRRRLAVSGVATLKDATVDALERADGLGLPAGFRAPASPLPLVELVRGEIDGFLVERFFKWDHAPWVLLVEEAGGRFSNPAGGDSGDAGGGLYSNAVLHKELLQLVGYL